MSVPAYATEPASEIAAPGLKVALSAHAVGAQSYACAAKAGGAPQWTFREPIATLIVDGKTIGRHFAGPTWALDDGSRVQGKVVATARGGGPGDIALLKLNVLAPPTEGMLAGVTTIQRLATVGGAKSGACDALGGLAAVPYAADYVFLKP